MTFHEPSTDHPPTIHRPSTDLPPTFDWPSIRHGLALLAPKLDDDRFVNGKKVCTPLSCRICSLALCIAAAHATVHIAAAHATLISPDLTPSTTFTNLRDLRLGSPAVDAARIQREREQGKRGRHPPQLEEELQARVARARQPLVLLSALRLLRNASDCLWLMRDNLCCF